MAEFGYLVKINNYCTHSEYEPEQFGSWYESYDNTFSHVSPSNGITDYPDVTSILQVKPGDKVFVVWLEYSSGDSFGHADRKYIETPAIFNNHEDAENLKKLIEDKKEDLDWRNENANHVLYNSNDGQKLNFYASWTGYFDSLDNVYIEEVTMSHRRD